MSELTKTQVALVWFELDTIEGISLDDLKRRFKKALSTHHPDRGGKEGDFEEIIEAYEYLSALIKRLMGGRSEKAVIDVADLIKQRDRDFVHEMNNMISDVFDEMERQKTSTFSMVFNETFQKYADPLISDGGYDTWLREEKKDYSYLAPDPEELKKRVEEQIQLRKLDLLGPLDDVKLDLQALSLGQAPQRGDDLPLPPNFQTDFVSELRMKYPDRVTTEAVILHPMEMAIVDGRCYGTDIIRRETRYHSSMYVNPEYVDLMEAYTSENTMIDKIPDFEETVLPSIEEIIQQREKVYECTDDAEMKQVHEYEQRYFDKEAKQKIEVETYFKTTGSASWALRDGHQTIYRDTGLDDEKGTE